MASHQRQTLRRGADRGDIEAQAAADALQFRPVWAQRQQIQRRMDAEQPAGVDQLFLRSAPWPSSNR